jgi:peptidoglycan/LPS O-acetylase OafA/YrhL
MKAVHKGSRYVLLDQVRGLCSILVFLHHGGFIDGALHFGSFGVDLFFFLSSFLLTFGLYKSICTTKTEQKPLRHHLKTLAKYFVRRTCRIYPFFFLLICILTIGLQSWRDAYFMPSKLDFVKTVLFFERYRYYVFWTLPVEFSYYFLIPVYVYMIYYTKRFWYVGNTAALFLSIYPSLYFYRAPPLNLDAHIGTFLAGSSFGIFFYYCQLFKFSKPQKIFLEILALVFLLIVISQGSKHLFYLNLNIPYRGMYPYISGFVGALFIKELIQPGFTSFLMDWSVFTFSGKISFSIYLLHPISLYYSNDLADHDKFIWAIIYTYGLGLFGYYVIEYPSEQVSMRVCRWIDAIGKNTLTTDTFQVFQV